MRPSSFYFLYQLMRSQWMSAGEIRRLQDEKLRRLVQYAYTQVPYYHRLFASVGLNPQDIKGVDDLAKIPTTSREMLRSLPGEEILARNIDLDRCHSTRTGGCTGIPLRLYHRRADMELTNLGWARAYLVNGFKPWQRMVEFRGRRYPEREKSWYEHFGLMRRKILNISDTMETWLSELQDWQPQALIGFPSTLKVLALAIKERGLETIRPKVIFSTSEILDDITRQILSSVFQARVVDIYGSEEARCIAWECPQCRGYHINSELVIVEFLQDGRSVPPGSNGQVVITNLHSFAMPFIRYEQADIGALLSTSSVCGRGLPLMSMVKGRLGDLVVLRHGQMVPPQIFSYTVAPVEGIAEWRVVQETVGTLRVEIVAAQGPNKRRYGWIKRRIEQNLRERVGDDLEFTIERVDSVRRGPGEKFRSVVSLVDVESYSIFGGSGDDLATNA
jgi:phenylacetate-CoA ligase